MTIAPHDIRPRGRPFVATEEAVRFEKYLVGFAPGEVRDRARFKKDIGLDPSAKRAQMTTARRHLLARGFVFRFKDGTVKRLDDDEKIPAAEDEIGCGRRKARKAARELGTVDYANLSRDARVRRDAAVSVAGAIVACGDPSSFARVAKKIEHGGGALPVADTLRLFGGK